ncbi:MAG: hypothetical protein ACYDEP_02800 [Acidimicrobiales bacterium]
MGTYLIETVAPGFAPVGADAALSEAGKAALDDALLAACIARWPDETFDLVEGGESSDEWNRLLAGNGWSEPTAEMSELNSKIIEDILCGDPEPGWWTRESDDDEAGEL